MRGRFSIDAGKPQSQPFATEMRKDHKGFKSIPIELISSSNLYSADAASLSYETGDQLLLIPQPWLKCPFFLSSIHTAEQRLFDGFQK